MERQINNYTDLAGRLVAPPYIYGSGTLSVEIRHLLRRMGLPVMGHLELNHLAASALVPYQIVSEASIEGELVVLGSNNEFFDAARIEAQLCALGADVLRFPELIRVLADRELAFEHFMLTTDATTRSEFGAHSERKSKKFQDPKSRETFTKLATYIVSLESVDYTPADQESLPFLQDRDSASISDAKFLEVGAASGDFLRELSVKPMQYVAVEPNSTFVPALRRLIAKSGVRGEVYHCAAGRENGRALMELDGTSSRIALDSSTKSIEVPMVRLDNLLENQQFDLIRLDVEGFEIDALAGAQGLIGRNRPVIGVAVYHRPGDLRSILDWVESTLKYRRFALRTHRRNFFDTFLYAAP